MPSFNPRQILKEIAIFAIIFIVLYSLVNWWRQPVPPQNPVLKLADYQGQIVDIQQISQDQATLIYFWGSWCHVCHHTTPKIQKLARDYPVVTVAVQSGNQHELSQYLKQNKYQFTTINDETGEIFNEWQGKVTPSYLIIKDDKIHQSFVGLQPLWLLKLRLHWVNMTS